MDNTPKRNIAKHFRAEFTVDEGLALQAKNLSEWKRKLNTRTYKLLESWTQCQNARLDETSSGFDVARGNTLANFVHNL